MTVSPQPTVGGDDKPAFAEGSRYRGYLLGLLATTLAFNYVDRLIIGLALQDIKRDLQLSDTQLGLLTGLAFALFYSVMGLPIARWVDRGNRVSIIAITTALWSVAVVISGMAANFVQLLLIRVVVAVGEAGCLPAANSLIPDHFRRSERPRAVALYQIGVPLSSVIGFFLGGWIIQFYGWRIALVCAGLPGIILALLAYFSLTDPRKAIGDVVVSSGSAGRKLAKFSDEAGFLYVCNHLWRIRSFRLLLFAFSITAFFGYGIQQWKPSFFIRSFGLQPGELGTWFALINGVGGILGLYLGGEIAARRASGNETLQLRVLGFLYPTFGLLSAAIYLAPNATTAFALMFASIVAGNLVTGPLFASIQTLVPARMRAMSIAFIYLFANLIGMGLGPLAVGIVSDALTPASGVESLRYSLLILCPGYLIPGLLLWRASKSIADDIAAAQSPDRTGTTST